MAMNNGPFLEEWPRTMAYFREMATGNGPFPQMATKNGHGKWPISQCGKFSRWSWLGSPDGTFPARPWSPRSSPITNPGPLPWHNAERPAHYISSVDYGHVGPFTPRRLVRGQNRHWTWLPAPTAMLPPVPACSVNLARVSLPRGRGHANRRPRPETTIRAS